MVTLFTVNTIMTILKEINHAEYNGIYMIFQDNVLFYSEF
jgi:hypothetical protein